MHPCHAEARLQRVKSGGDGRKGAPQNAGHGARPRARKGQLANAQAPLRTSPRERRPARRVHLPPAIQTHPRHYSRRPHAKRRRSSPLTRATDAPDRQWAASLSSADVPSRGAHPASSSTAARGATCGVLGVHGVHGVQGVAAACCPRCSGLAGSDIGGAARRHKPEALNVEGRAARSLPEAPPTPFLAQRTGPLLRPRQPPVGHTNASAFSNALKALRSAPGAASTPRRDRGQYSNFPSRQRRATPWRSLSAPLAPKCGRAQSPGSLACARRPNVHRGAGDAATPKVCLFCARSRARPKASCSRAPAPLQAAPSAKQRSHRL